MDELTPEQREEWIWNVVNDEGWTNETLLDIIINFTVTDSEAFESFADHLDNLRVVWIDADVDFEDDSVVEEFDSFENEE